MTGPQPSRAESIAATYAGFRQGASDAVNTVRGWTESIVHGGNWRFSDADGVTQETLLKLVKLAADDKVKDPESFQKFVYTVSKNTCVTTYHRERTRESREQPADDHEEPSADPAATDRLERQDRLDTLAEILQRLPELCRTLWERIYFQHKPPAEVAEELKITAGNLRVRIHRCTERARTIFGELSHPANLRR